jgi:hypothetical protein
MPMLEGWCTTTGINTAKCPQRFKLAAELEMNCTSILQLAFKVDSLSSSFSHCMEVSLLSGINGKEAGDHDDDNISCVASSGVDTKNVS